MDPCAFLSTVYILAPFLKASLNRKKKLSNAQNYLHFTCLIRKIGRKELNSYNASGMTLFQKGKDIIPTRQEFKLGQCNTGMLRHSFATLEGE